MFNLSSSLSSPFHPRRVFGFLALILMAGAAILPPLSLVVVTTITSMAKYRCRAGRPKKNRKIIVSASWNRRRGPLRTTWDKHDGEFFIFQFSCATGVSSLFLQMGVVCTSNIVDEKGHNGITMHDICFMRSIESPAGCTYHGRPKKKDYGTATWKVRR